MVISLAVALAGGGALAGCSRPAVVSGELSPAVEQAREAGSLSRAAVFTFGVDSTRIDAGERQALAALAGQLKAEGVTEVVVVGHTDDQGGSDYNLALSRNRARAVAEVLGAALPPTVTLTAIGRGESEPVADNKDEPGRSRNRRVEVLVP
jgi:outer membrane protein OmpA-like peptidoglycan-associated protein